MCLKNLVLLILFSGLFVRTSAADEGVTPQQQKFVYPPAVELKAGYFPRWLGIVNVQKELELTPAQIEEVGVIERSAARAQPSPSKKIADVLTTQQLHRLDQIYWHFAGGLATRDPEVANSLGLSEEQRTSTLLTLEK